MNALIDKNQFIGLEHCAWLYSGAESPPHRGVLSAMQDYVMARSKGPEGRAINEQVEESCRRQVAAMMEGSQEQIALVSNVSEAINQIAQMIPFQPGDNVVINNLEFPSGVLPWLRHEKVEVRVVAHQNWQVAEEDMLAHVDEKTRLVVVSHVSFMTGSRLNYKRLYEQLKDTNTLLLLDVTQSLGVVPVELSYADFVVCSSYKWLLSVHGAGIMAVNPERTKSLLPPAAGWRSVSDLFNPDRFRTFEYYSDARKFELGYPSFPTLYAMNYSTKLLLDIGIDKIEQHVLALGGELMNQLRQLGFKLMTPKQPERRAGNISIVCDQGEYAAELLAEQGIYVWGGDQRLRMSVHAFNDLSDVEKVVQALGELKSSGKI